MYPAHPVTAMISWKAGRAGAEKFASAASARAKTHVGIPAHGSRVLPGVSDGALEGAASESVCMAPFSAPFSGFCPQLRSLCKGRDGGCRSPVSGMRPLPFCHPQSRAMAMRTEGFAFRTVSSRRTMPTHSPYRPPCVPHRHARRAVRGMKRKARSDARRFPRVAGGRPFSASPVREVLRRSLKPRADPASLQRLAVYPRRDGGIVGMGGEGGEIGGRIFVQRSAQYRRGK